MDRGQTFVFPWIDPRYFSHMIQVSTKQGWNRFFKHTRGSVMVTPSMLGSVGRQHLCYTDPPIVHNNGRVYCK